ncbi:L-serine dehydratase [Pullulanibacillus pueri]|uniref:L-serine deaminase n=1 Tax=Pullulanibacillus pueri TaxID=1437324 RepID=A0A8J2ZS76_9BACL|nr:L-serine ammonia-lyase, iron-sulfur-dependent subunit beta [Pullulanibacillus pueri]MBM7680192.1 L-serine dehydratase [Pullulanibacillus pueri]GGH74820.1 L-serine dehydratase, iron-sulfur-dependent subunit beta [Pullulanibacillus pueri]
MKFRSVFDIIGPVMIGPSSSHTAGAARIGRVARQLFGKQPEQVNIHLFGSFAKTYKGHGTDVALIGGLLDYDTDDERIVDALSYAEDIGLKVNFFEEEEEAEHPNTVRLVLKLGEEEMKLTGVSIGGGKVEVVELNDYELKLSGNGPALFILHHDRYGAVATVAGILAKHEINISYMEVSRKVRGETALMVIETDQSISKEVADEITGQPYMYNVATLD